MAMYILDTRLSRAHYTICTEAIRRGIINAADLNEGRRTMAEQWAFYRNQPPLAAFPSPGAPHIWWGLPDHAIDSNSWNRAAQKLAGFYQSLGIPVAFNVPGENWHFHVQSRRALLRAAKKIRKRRDLEVSKLGEREPRINFFKFQLFFIKDSQGHRYFTNERPEDGYSDLFTEDLKNAVRKFQKDHDLKPDGVIGPQTDRKIDRKFAKQKRNRRSALERAKERKIKHARGEL